MLSSIYILYIYIYLIQKHIGSYFFCGYLQHLYQRHLACHLELVHEIESVTQTSANNMYNSVLAFKNTISFLDATSMNKIGENSCVTYKA